MQQFCADKLCSVAHEWADEGPSENPQSPALTSEPRFSSSLLDGWMESKLRREFSSTDRTY